MNVFKFSLEFLMECSLATTVVTINHETDLYILKRNEPISSREMNHVFSFSHILTYKKNKLIQKKEISPSKGFCYTSL